MGSRGPCSFSGCDRTSQAKGLCKAHWSQQNRGRELTPIGEMVGKYTATPAADDMKVCCICKTEKHLDDFYRATKGSKGRQSRCIDCTKAHDAIRPPRKNTPERRDRYFTETYGLTLEQVEQMKRSQGGVCAICNATPQRWVVDHCHETGRVRGMLCDTCNRSLGLLKDDVDVLMSAAAYLLAQQDVLALAGESNG